MLELSSKDDLYTFTYDGQEHSIRALMVDDVDALGVVLKEKNPTKRAQIMKKELAARAEGDTAAVIDGLALKNMTSLFKGWAGIRLGESSSSDES